MLRQTANKHFDKQRKLLLCWSKDSTNTIDHAIYVGFSKFVDEMSVQHFLQHFFLNYDNFYVIFVKIDKRIVL